MRASFTGVVCDTKKFLVGLIIGDLERSEIEGVVVGLGSLTCLTRDLI